MHMMWALGLPVQLASLLPLSLDGRSTVDDAFPVTHLTYVIPILR